MLMALFSVVAGAGISTGPDATGVARAAPATVDVAGLTKATVLSFGSGTPVGFRFAPDGRIYVTMKEGRVLMYDGLGDTTPVTTLNISSQVHTFVDRGLLGMTLDPGFSTGRPYMYVLYTYNRDPFGSNTTVPRWVQLCPNPPGGGTDGCTVTARLERYTIDANGVADPASRLLVLDGVDGPLGGWCAQFQSHSIGTVEFGTDGQLYVGAGDGAWYGGADYGQKGGSQSGTPTPPNPCNDTQTTADPAVHAGARGAPLTATTSRGGAVRSQAVRNALSNEYVSWDGAILRIDPTTGAASAGNPLTGNGITGDDRIVAYGLRNPFRFTFRPGTNDLWIGDVGYNTYEEVDTVTLGAGAVPNFGWPCYEGPARQSAYDALDIGLCESLYTTNTSMIGGVPSPLVPPKYTWSRFGNNNLASPLPCGSTNGGGASVGGAFVTNPLWPASLNGAYIFADYSRACLMAMPLDGSGQPDPTKVVSIASNVAPVDIKVGPGGDVFYVDIVAKQLIRIRPASGPSASFTATPTYGALPLSVTFDASATTDANQNEVLSYAWDLDGDGACDDATGVTVQRTYATAATVAITLCVTDQANATDTTSRTIQPGNTPPVIQSVTTSADGVGWKVGDTITYNATASVDGQPVPASSYVWAVVIQHCDAVGGAACHSHPLQELPLGPSGSLVTPDHEFYAYLTLTLTVTDASGLSAVRSIDLIPRLSSITVVTDPPGIDVTAGGRSGTSPYTQQFLEGGDAQIIVPGAATIAGRRYTFVGWADRTRVGTERDALAPAGATTYTAQFVAGQLTPVPPVRLLDTRVDGAALGAGATTRLQIAGVSGVPSDATAVVVNLTALGRALPGYVTAFSCGAVPNASNLNVAANDTVANLVTVPLDDRGGVCFTTQQSADLVVDLAAVVSGTGMGYTGIAPQRVADTRNGTGLDARRIRSGEVAIIPLAASALPADATAVVATITVTNPEAAGYISAFPCATAPPLASNLNYATGQTVSNLAITSLGSSRQLCVVSSQTADVIVDVSGWLSPSGQAADLVAPSRAVDTRLTARRLQAGGTIELDASVLSAPANARAMVINVTAVDTALAGYLTVYPCGGPPPLASNVNYGPNENRPVLAIARLGQDRRVCIYSLTSLDIVVDLDGWIVG